MKAVHLFLIFTLVSSSLSAQNNSSGRNFRPGPPKLVVVGDSLSAGVQNFSLLDSQQKNGYASILAAQAGWHLSLPEVPSPGLPNVLYVKSFDPLQITQVGGQLDCARRPLICLRDNPGVQPNNIAVPGLTVGTALTLRPTFPTPATSPEQVWATAVLGLPNLPFRAPTEVEMAKILRPDILIDWLGNNDALVPALTGQIQALTSTYDFQRDYRRVLDQLGETHAKIITATIPDVTEIAFFTSAQSIAGQSNLPLSYVTQSLGIGPNDYVRPSAAPFVSSILMNPATGPLPTYCDAPLPDLGASQLPCVLTEADANTVRGTVNCYNKIITSETQRHQGVLVDIHALVDQIYVNGFSVGEKRLTTDFFGGLFSLDGIHPTNTGYGIIANEFINAMNAQLRTNIPPADLGEIQAADPLAMYPQPPPSSHTLPVETIVACPAGY